MNSQFALVDVVQRLARCRDLAGVMSVLQAATRHLVSADGATVVLRDGDCCYYAEENAIAPLWKGKRFPMQTCISGWCMLNKQRVAIPDIYADERIPHDAYRPTFVQSLAMVPIRSTDPIGAIGAYWADHHQATDEELATMQALGDSASVAMANIELIASLREASESKDRFVMMLAHELRNPLAPIRNALHLIDKGRGEAAKAGRQMMKRQVRHLSRIVDGLLDVSRITRGHVTLTLARVDLVEIARNCIDDRRKIVEDAGLKLHVDLASGPLFVNGDATRLCEIIDNLLDNAVKFSNPGGAVTVRLQRDDDRAVLAVVDDGIGIDRVMLGRIFEVFAQADESLDRTRGGIGIGLSVAKGLVELHGGKISVLSDGVGKGSIFEVTLPLDESLETPAPADAPNESHNDKLNIVVVEDNRDSAESLRLLLRLYGHRVTVAHNGRDAVTAATKEKPDVMLCDIGLPDMDGFAVAREVRAHENGRHARLIAITGYGENEDRQRALDSGFDFHLVKPVEPEELFAYFKSGR
jgi:signal transduction histidine kinase/CheY-like chemotaxis protein